jgi:hypothetical protein
MRRAWVAVATFAAIATACTVRGEVEPSISPPVPGGVASPSATPTPAETGSPAPASPLSTGVATLALSGDLTQTVTLPNLATPAVWAPPPAPMDIAWTGGGREFRLSGTSFVSLAVTSADHVLSFTMLGPDGPLEFSSADGGCSITITPALPDNVGGVFVCDAITDAGGGTTVDARGTFAASG